MQLGSCDMTVNGRIQVVLLIVDGTGELVVIDGLFHLKETICEVVFQLGGTLPA